MCFRLFSSWHKNVIMNSPIEVQCEFCLESIPEEASVCKYCQSNQNQRGLVLDVIGNHWLRSILFFLFVEFSLNYQKHILFRGNFRSFSNSMDGSYIAVGIFFVLSLIGGYYIKNTEFEELKNIEIGIGLFQRLLKWGLIISIFANIFLFSLYVGKENAPDFKSFVEIQEQLTPCQIELESEGRFCSYHILLQGEKVKFFLGSWGKYYQLNSIPLEEAFVNTGTNSLEEFRRAIKNDFSYERIFLKL